MLENKDHHYMQEALEEAKKAAALGEVPIGAVIVYKDEIIARAHNLRETTQNALTHAESMAIQEACSKIGSWRLEETTMYVTLEPCPMCGWAILQSRIKSVYFGSYDTNYGAFTSKIDLRHISTSKPNVYGGIMEEECDELLTSFFKKIR